VGHDHHIKIFDLAKSELFLLKLNTKDIGSARRKVISSSRTASSNQHIIDASRSMVTLDESGKALVFSPDVSNQEVVASASGRRTIRGCGCAMADTIAENILIFRALLVMFWSILKRQICLKSYFK
jgi:hypothetical protein